MQARPSSSNGGYGFFLFVWVASRGKLGFRILGLTLEDLGIRIQGIGFRFWGLKLRLCLRVSALGFTVRV